MLDALGISRFGLQPEAVEASNKSVTSGSAWPLEPK